MSTATVGATHIGSKIYEKGSETYESAQQNAYVSDITEKSKVALNTVGSTVTGLTSVSIISGSSKYAYAL